MTGRRAEVATKLDALRSWLDGEGLEAVVIGSQAGFAWVTAGGDAHVSLGDESAVGSVLVTADDAFLLTTNIEVARLLDEEVTGLGLTAEEWPWHEPDAPRATLERLCRADRAVSDLGSLGLDTAPPSLNRLRYTLLEPEVERFRRLGIDAAEATEAACAAARPGDTELDVSARLAHECRRRRILPLVDLVGSDERISRYRHPVPTAQRVRRTLLVALTGRRHGLHASLTRMVAFGGADDEQVVRHRAVARVDARLLLESRPGAGLAEVFALGVEQYRAEGFADQWRLHHQGGLTGYGGREVFATPSAEHRLEASQAVAWNPSITGVKSEDTVLVTDHGPEVLTRTRSWPQARVELDDAAVERPTILTRAT
jgi:Xaa-Pro aminopeptidase